MSALATLTPKGAATRARIVQRACDLILQRGIGATSLDDIRALTETSKSQLFHYFPGGKSELVGAIAAYEVERLLEAQRPALDRLDSWAEWDRWRDALLAHYATRPQTSCPVGALTAEVSASDPRLAAEVVAHQERWRAHFERGLARMRDNGLIDPAADPYVLSLSVFSAVQGGLLLVKAQDSLLPLEAALDGALRGLRALAA